jgi:hypothetical protein
MIRKDTMYKLIETILTQFKSCFKRNSTFECFVVIVIGMLLRKDFRGISVAFEEAAKVKDHLGQSLLTIIVRAKANFVAFEQAIVALKKAAGTGSSCQIWQKGLLKRTFRFPFQRFSTRQSIALR